MAVKTLYVGNLPYTTTESHLTSHFANYGATNARIMEGRGFGFVDVDENQAQTAIADKHNSSLEGRTLTVNEAKPRESRSGGGSGGSRYGNSHGGGNSRSNRW